jgi:methionyl-tRNA formyltransferase
MADHPQHPQRRSAESVGREPGEGKGAPGEILGASKDGLIVACGEQALCLTRLQLPGGKALNFSDLFNSRREKFAVGTVLGRGGRQ